MVLPDVNFSADFLKKLLSAGSAPMMVLVIIITQYVFKLKFACPCSSSTWSTLFTAMYLVLPCFSILVIALLIDKQFKKAAGYCCIKRSCHWPWTQFFKGLTIASMWIITALLEGDWFICTKSMNGNNAYIACKNNHTEGEILIFNKFKSESHIYGFGCLCGVSLFWLVHFCVCSKTAFYRQKYHKCLEKQTHLHIKKQLKDMAKDKAQSICEEPFRSIRKKEQLPQQQNQQQDQLQQQLFLQVQLLVQQQHQWLEGQQQGQHAPRGQEANVNNPTSDASNQAPSGEQAPAESTPDQNWIKISDPTFHIPTSSSKNGSTTTKNASLNKETAATEEIELNVSEKRGNTTTLTSEQGRLSCGGCCSVY